MKTHAIRVLTQETVLRIGLQNQVVRKLRALRCKALSVALDPELTIVVDPADAEHLHLPGGRLTRRTMAGNVVSVDIDGCKVTWTEARAS